MIYKILYLTFQDLRLATTIALVIGLFIICWAPFFATNSFFALCSKVDKTLRLCMTYPFDIADFIKFLQYGNSACNPVIYGFRNNDFRRAFRKMLMRLICKKVPLTHWRSTKQGTSRFTTKPTLMARDSSFGDSRSIIFTEQLSQDPFDYRASYRKAIANGRKRPNHIRSKLILKNSFFTRSGKLSQINGYTTEELALDGKAGLQKEEQTMETTLSSFPEDKKVLSIPKSASGNTTKRRKSRLRVKFNASTKGGSVVQPTKENLETISNEGKKKNYLFPERDENGSCGGEQLRIRNSPFLAFKEKRHELNESHFNKGFSDA